MALLIWPAILPGHHGPAEQKSVQQFGIQRQAAVQNKPGQRHKRQHCCRACDINGIHFLSIFETPALPDRENSSAALHKNIFIFSGCSPKNCTLSGNGKFLFADTSCLIFYKILSVVVVGLTGRFCSPRRATFILFGGCLGLTQLISQIGKQCKHVPVFSFWRFSLFEKSPKLLDGESPIPLERRILLRLPIQKISF